MHARCTSTLLLLLLGFTATAVNGGYLRGTFTGVDGGVAAGEGSTLLAALRAASTPPDSPPALRSGAPFPIPEQGGDIRRLTGALGNHDNAVKGSMPQRHGQPNLAIGTPPLQTVQGQALGPAELPALLPFASPYVGTP